MPLVRITLFNDTSLEAKRKIVEGITNVIVTTLNKKPEVVSIYIEETTKENVAKGGVLVCDAKPPGSAK